MDDEGVLAAVGPRLRQLRLEREATLTDLAEETGISVSTLSRLESGQRKPTLELLLPLARAHRVALDELVDAPETGDPRIRSKPVVRHGRTFISLTRRPGGLQSFKMVMPVEKDPRPTLQTHEGYEWLYVLSGRVRLVLGAATSCSSPARWPSSTPARPTGSATPDRHPPRCWRSSVPRANGCTSAPEGWAGRPRSLPHGRPGRKGGEPRIAPYTALTRVLGKRHGMSPNSLG